ncbi:MAG TPA: alcohol dehydrogenase catalytic domain-containing protein [Steroidobacteraceae bacterium]
MKAVVFHGIGDIRLETVRDPKLKEPTDALIRITASAICGTDLHFIRGTLSGLESGTILGHEAVGVIEEVGKDVRNFKPGDRVVVPSTICCGYCSYCRAGYQSQCDVAHPKGPHAGTPYYGGGEEGGGFDGLQAEYARVAYAAANLVRLPDGVSRRPGDPALGHFPDGVLRRGHRRDQAGRHGSGVRLRPGRPVRDRERQAARRGARVRGGLRRLAPRDGARPGRGSHRLQPRGPGGCAAAHDRRHRSGPGDRRGRPRCDGAERRAGREGGEAAARRVPQRAEGARARGEPARQAVARGRRSVASAAVGREKPRQGRRKYVPELVDLVESGVVDPAEILTQTEPLADAIEAYKAFDRRESGWVKVELKPEAKERKAA